VSNEIKPRKAVKTGKPYRGHAGSTYQDYIVTMSDGSERRTSVVTAYGNQSAAVAKIQVMS